MKKPKIENNCTNCLKSDTCRMAQGVVVWKNCGTFQPDVFGLRVSKKPEKPATPCRHGEDRRYNDNEDEVYCELHGRWMSVTLGECLGVCSSEESRG